MSDLHHAVQAEIAAHTPTRPPSFDALKGRKHRRDRRRTVAAVTASALAAAGIAFVPSALGGNSDPAPPQVAQSAGDNEVFGFGVKATDVEAATAEGGGGPEALQRCLELPGLSKVGALFSYPGQYSGRVTGRGNADALKSCVDGVPGWEATLTPVGTAGEAAAKYTLAPDGRTPNAAEVGTAIRRCLALPGIEWEQPFTGAPAVYRVAASSSAAAIDFETCAKGFGGYTAVPMSDAAAELLKRCAAAGNKFVVPSYIGLTEEAAMRTKPADVAARVGAVRVTARDGQCLPVTADYRSDRVNLIVQDGEVIWAEMQEPALTGSSTSRVTLSRVGRGCGPSDMVGIVGTVTGPPSLLDYDGLQVEVKAEGVLVGSAALTDSDFIVYPKGGRELPETADVTVVTDDGVVVASEAAVDLRFRPDDRESICG